MDKVEELLPDLDNFLRKILVKEKLSKFAEKRRIYYIERLDFLKSNPPSLPPRPDGGLMKFPVVDGIPSSATISSPVVTNGTKHGHSDTEEENIYADMDDNDPKTPTGGENPYLVPESTGTLSSNAADLQGSWSDSDSGTSYESYGEEDPEDSMYMNVDNPPGSADDVPLPNVQIVSIESHPWEENRVAKKKKKVHREELPIETLPNVTFKGELHQKGSWSWTKRYCVISDNRLIVYRNEKDSRPIMKLVLLGYDVEYIEKEGRRSNVIRISHPGCESHYFAADLKEIADLWCCYLSPGSDGEVPSSGDSNTTQNDSTKNFSSSNQHSISASSTSASNLSGSSEGGSGDGVTTQISPSRVVKQADDKGSSSTEKKKKNILSDILGTFSKKKGQKVKKSVVVGDLPVDPDAVISGILDVLHETQTNNEWCPKYCEVKNNKLLCYNDNVSEGVDFSFLLTGSDIESAGKETKKELSIRLTFSNKEQVLLDTSDMIEQGKWLHVLIKAKQGMLDKPTTEADNLLYENQGMVDNLTADQQDDIYDEVDTCNMINGNQNTRTDQDNNPRVISRPILRTSSGASSSDGQNSSRPPPLPQTDPPKRPLSSIKRRSRESEQEDEYENYQEKNQDKYNLSDEMASAFTKIKSQMETTRAAPKTSTSSQDRSRSREPSQTKGRPSEVSSKTEEGVVKCHLGPAIAEDKELLKTTLNPILSDLRKEKRQGSLDADTLNSQIEEIRRKLLTMKKQKSELRGKLLTSRLSREKQTLESQLRDLDQLIEESEQTVTRLQLLSLEKTSNLSRNSSFQSQTSSSSSRSGSFKEVSNGTGSSLQKTTRKSTDRPRAATKTSPTGIQDKYSSETSPRSAVGKKTEDKVAGSKGHTTPYASFVTKSSARSTTTTTTTVKSAGKTTSPTGRPTHNKWTAGAGTTQQNKGSSIGGSTKNEQTRTRTVLASTTVKSGSAISTSVKSTTSSRSGVGTTSAVKAGSGTASVKTGSGTTSSRSVSSANVKSTTGPTSASKEESSKTRKGVQERLKLWEAMTEESPC